MSAVLCVLFTMSIKTNIQKNSVKNQSAPQKLNLCAVKESLSSSIHRHGYKCIRIVLFHINSSHVRHFYLAAIVLFISFDSGTLCDPFSPSSSLSLFFSVCLLFELNLTHSFGFLLLFLLRFWTFYAFFLYYAI